MIRENIIREKKDKLDGWMEDLKIVIAGRRLYEFVS